MNWPAQCAVIIPCLNESATIGPLVAAVRSLLPAIVVIDDGSDDDTGRRAAEAGAVVLRNDRARGKGAALQRGWDWARERGFSWVLTLDGDGQHSPADIPLLLRRAGERDADLVVGNRMIAPEGMPRVRRLVNRWMSRRISRRAGCELPDTQSGFRLIRLGALEAISPDAAHFEIESEVLLACARSGRRIEFVPIQVIYKAEQSKIHPLLDTFRWFKWWQSVKARGSEKVQVEERKPADLTGAQESNAAG